MSGHLSYRTVLYATVFTTGAAVLILEIIAVRLLSPYFGTSLFVLSSVLTTILAALALGYYYGGRLADHFPHHVPLYTIIAGSGLILSALFGLSQFLLPIAPALFSLVYGPLVVAVLFFFLPAFLLGIDSPFVIKLLSDRAPHEAGSVVGTTFFWSTLGSIAGSLGTGFFLIPFVGLRITILGTALVLALGALFAAWYLSRHDQGAPATSPVQLRHIASISTLTVCIILLIIGIGRRSDTVDTWQLLYEADGYYAQIRIFDVPFSPSRPPARLLQREVNAESAIYQDSVESVFPYSEFARLYRDFHHTSSTTFLMLGGGAYTIPRMIIRTDPDVMVDVAELEPLLYPLARTYFDLPSTSQLRNHLTDARVFVESTTTRYDTIFLDAFNSGHYIPPHLTTIEFFKSVRARLATRGLLIINYVGARDLPAPALTESLFSTITKIFPNAQAFTFSTSTPARLHNIVFIASSDDVPLPLFESTLTILETGATVSLKDLAVPLRPNDRPITDDRAPVEYLVAKQLLATQ